MNSKVSIIIPVYNAEKHIARCINSIISQTYKNIEIIIINDGSTDLSEEIILKLQKENKDIIKYYKHENKGVSKTRNFGIEVATGKYVMFIDNDDYIDNDYVETFVNEAESKNYDVVIGGHRRTNEKNKVLIETRIPNTRWGKYITLTPWARIFKRSYLTQNKIEFLPCNIGEDIFFNIQAITISEQVGIIDYVGYDWFYNTASVSNTIQKNFYDVEAYKLLNESYKVIKEKKILEKKEEQEYIELFWFLFIIWLFIYTGRSLNYKQLNKEYKKVFEWMEKKFPNYKKNKLVGFTKLEGETLFNRIKLTVFMTLHKLHLGHIALFIYTRIWEKLNG